MLPTPRILVILGPTAGGKTDLAVALAQTFHGEIISADSMQVYRHLDAATAKPSPAQRDAVPHHLIDVADPAEPFTVADWLDRAEAIIADLHQREKLPIVVGGTNLYLKALLEGMFEGPPTDEPFRQSLADTPAQILHDRLKTIDPAAADRIHPNDRKRILRALEVHHATGKPISDLQQQWSEPPPPSPSPSPFRQIENRKSKIENPPYRHNPILIGLRWPVPAINRRINARAKSMFHPPADPPPGSPAGGESILEETRRLLDAGLLGPPQSQARQAIGTKQVLDHLSGRYTAEEALERVKIDTRRFAKAQRTWLKRYRNVHWLDADEIPPDQLTQAAIQIVQAERTNRKTE